MRNHTTFSDFSALHMAPAAAPAADTRCGQDDAVPDSAGMSQGRIIAPPFSWLGGDAWPDFPARADTAP